MNRLVLFLLIAFPLTIGFSSPPDGDYVTLNRILASIGSICLLGWIFAVGHKANGKLVMQGMKLNYFQFFNWAFFVTVICFILLIIYGKDVNVTVNNMKVHYFAPIYLLIILCVLTIITIIIAAKTLVSAELNKDATIAEYFPTTLLMIFYVIGIWFIQPRVQKL